MINEAVWRNFSTAIWVDFKVFGIMPLIFLFALAQTPLVHEASDRRQSRRLNARQPAASRSAAGGLVKGANTA